MAARTDRRTARQRVTAAFQKAMDQIIPDDESAPLRGRTFEEWERQADAFDHAVTTTLLEQRALLKDTAQVQAGGCGASSGGYSHALIFRAISALRLAHSLMAIGW